MYPCGVTGVDIGAAFPAWEGPPSAALISPGVKLLLCSAREVSLSAMANGPSHPAPHWGLSRFSCQRKWDCPLCPHWCPLCRRRTARITRTGCPLVNAKVALMVRQIPRAFVGGPKKSSVDCDHNRRNASSGRGTPPARLETQSKHRIPAGLPMECLDRAAPSNPDPFVFSVPRHKMRCW